MSIGIYLLYDNFDGGHYFLKMEHISGRICAVYLSLTYKPNESRDMYMTCAYRVKRFRDAD